MICLFLLYLLAADPNQAASLLQQGLLALQHGRLEQAQTDLEQASRLEPKNAYVWSSLAEVYLRRKDGKRASQAAEKAESLGGENPIICHALAMYYSEAGQVSRAAKLEQRFAESPRADANASSRAAELYLEAGDWQPGLELARQAEQQHPSAANDYLLARALAASGQQTAAAEHYQSAWESDRTDPRIAFDWAQVQLRRGEFTQAAAVIEAALAAHPDDAQLTLALGVARYGQRRFEEAITAFLKVIKIDPQIEQPYLFLGRMLDQAGSHLAEITTDYENWLARSPGNARAQLLMAKALLAKDSRDAAAEPLLRRSIELNPKDWEAHYELGLLLENRRDFAAATGELEKSAQLNPSEPMIHYHLARVFDRLGQAKRAQEEREIHARLIDSSRGMSHTEAH